MIDHSNCDHPRTPSGRAKCRRGQDGSTPTRTRGKRSAREAVPWSGPLCPDETCVHGSCYRIRYGLPEDNYGQTPGRREDECHICHVEKIEFIGKDAWSGRTYMVGEKCAWRVKRSPEFRALTT